MQKLKAVCANTPASHTPLPHQVVPLEHFCVGRSSCCTVALTHPQIIEQPWGPDPVVQQWCCFHCPRGQLCLSQGRVWFQRAKTTADTWLGGSPISYLFKNEMLLLLVFVCLLACFFHFMKIFHPNFLLFSWSESNWHTEIGQQFSSLFSKAILLDCFLLMRYPREVSGKSLGLPPFPLESHRLPVHWVGHKFLQAWDFPQLSDWQALPWLGRDLWNLREMLSRTYTAACVSWFLRPLLGRSDDDIRLLFDVKKKWFAPVIVFRVFLDYINEPIEKEELVKMDEDGWG